MKINGIVLVNKDRGISSNSVVNKVKHILQADKAGHLGTLDVLGEGLLPVTLGKATKLFDYYLTKDKIYRTIFKFGETTATLDLEGEITNRDDRVVSPEDILKVLPKLVGKQLQMPPLYSAKKINGKKAYELAREGSTNVALKPKEIEIYSINFIKQLEKNTFLFEIHCSSGTYIRSICRDLASRLSTYGVMQYIQRTRCGDFDLKDANTINEIENGKFKIIELDSLFDYDKLSLDEQQASKLLNGVKIKYAKDGVYRAYCEQFLGLVTVKDGLMSFKLRLI